MARDGRRCILTNDPTAQAAHIYPFYGLEAEEDDLFGVRHMFWDQLSLFWPESTITRWKQEVFPRGVGHAGVETVLNLLTLSYDTHAKWKRGAFAIKPISMSDDEMRMQVKFFWQRKQDDATTMSLLNAPFSTKDLDGNEGAYEHGPVQEFNYKTRSLIKSGDIFELQTDYPDQRPLPSFALLEIQFFLMRIVGITGAGQLYKSDWEDEDDWEVSDLGLDR